MCQKSGDHGGDPGPLDHGVLQHQQHWGIQKQAFASVLFQDSYNAMQSPSGWEPTSPPVLRIPSLGMHQKMNPPKCLLGLKNTFVGFTYRVWVRGHQEQRG